MTLNDFELPKYWLLVIILRFPAASHILRLNCTEIAADGPGQLAYDIFSIERTFLRI